MEKKISSEKVYDGKIINLRRDLVELENKNIVLREVVEHNGGVAIALEDNNKFYLVNQYRYGAKQELLEFPAGKIEKGEDIFETCKREIIEETGYSGKDFYFLGSMVPTGAYLEEIIYMYYAKKNEFIGQHLDNDEFLDVYLYSLDEIIDMIMTNKIKDAKTIAMAFMIRELKLCEKI